MNPLMLFLLCVGILKLVIGFRGKQDNVIAATTGKQWRGSTLS